MSSEHKVFDFRDIDYESIEEHFDIGEMTDCDTYRESESIPTFKGEKLRFQSPWLYCPFGWGQYNTLVLSSFSNRSFPLDHSADKKKFRGFLKCLDKYVQQYVKQLKNPDMLSTTISSHISYNDQYQNFQYRFPIQKKFLDSEGNFEGKVFKCTSTENPEYQPSSVKAIEGKSYASFVGYIGKVSQSRNTTRYKVIIEQIAWFPLDKFIVNEKEELACDTNMFMNVPTFSSKKRKASSDKDQAVQDTKDTKKTKNSSETSDDINVDVEYT
jgi:hypothetical protein